MFKKNCFIICGITAFLLSGCTKSNIATGEEPVAPVFETREGIVLDWGQIGDNLDETFLENADYPMAVSINYSVDMEKHIVDLTLMVKEGTTPEEAVYFADAVVRTLNDEAAVQDFSFEKSSAASYGGFLKENTVNLIVMPDGMMIDHSKWLIDMSIPAGSDEKIVPIEGAKAMETAAAEESQAESESDGKEAAK